jgi:D-3-phosphoglycerate dehydrogenase / 2-oxoglutarate reductase
MGEEPLHGRRAHRQDAGRDRLRQYRLDRRRRAPRPEDEGDRLRSVPLAERAVELGVEKVELDELLARADFITLHTPLTDKTRNILSARPRQDQEGRAHHQLRARRPRRRGGAARGARFRPCRRRGASTCSSTEPATDNPLFGCPTSSARRISAPPPRGAGERRAAGRRADVGLSADAAPSPTPSTFPSISAEEAPKLKPFIALAEKLGSFAGQLTDTGVDKVTITYEGHVAGLNTKALTAAALAGLLRPMLEDVNVVSAPIVAKERGVVDRGS